MLENLELHVIIKSDVLKVLHTKTTSMWKCIHISERTRQGSLVYCKFTLAMGTKVRSCSQKLWWVSLGLFTTENHKYELNVESVVQLTDWCNFVHLRNTKVFHTPGCIKRYRCFNLLEMTVPWNSSSCDRRSPSKTKSTCFVLIGCVISAVEFRRWCAMDSW